MKLIKIVLLLLALLTSSFAFAAVTKPPPPPSTGSATLDAINKFIYDTVNWQQGDPVPDTGSSTLNAIGKAMLDTANYGTGSSGSAGGGFGGTGAGGDWSSDPYNGNGGQISPIKDLSCSNIPDPTAFCISKHGANDWWGKTSGKLVGTTVHCVGTTAQTGPPNYSLSMNSCNVTCPNGYTFDSSTKKCVSPCPAGQKLDPNTNKCVVDPNQCLSPYTFINGVCVPPKQPDPETKTCPYGYTLDTATNSCVKDPEKPCDPAVQECNPDGTVKCDCCQKLDTIIGNQGVQIGLQNKSNASLSQIIANQQTNNLKLDQLNNQLTQLNSIAQNTNSNLQLIQNQIAELLKLQKEGVKLDIEPITKKIDEIITNANKNQADKLTNDNKNHNDLTGLIAKSLIDSSTEQPYLQQIIQHLKEKPDIDLEPVTDRQDEQTDILKEIRDLFKEDKENPTPPPEVTPEEQESSLNNPLDGLKNYDISQNRFGASQVQCPPDRQFVALGATFTIGMSQYCGQMQILGYVFLMMSYIAGGIIVVKGAGGN